MDQSTNKVLSQGFYKNVESQSVHGDPGGCPLCCHVIVLVPLNFIGVTCEAIWISMLSICPVVMFCAESND